MLADRLTKTWVSNHIPLGGAIPVIPPRSAHHALDQRGRGLLAVRRLGLAAHRSLGAGRLHASGRVVVLVAMVRLGDRITLTTVALALVLAGALGNVHDRIAYGSVVDFIEVHIFSYHWPDFNMADSSIVTGACLLMLDSLLPKKSGQVSENKNREPVS